MSVRNIKGEMRDENRKVRTGYALFRRRDRMVVAEIIIQLKLLATRPKKYQKGFICFINGLKLVIPINRV